MDNKSLAVPCTRSVAALELKSLSADGRFAGYASVFGIIDSQRDVVHRGAFSQSLKARSGPLQLLWQHLWNEPIGVIDRIFEDARGLYVEGRLLMEVARAREAFALLKSGALKGLSIGYTVKSFRRNPDSGVRELLEIELWEVSLVTMPANVQAQVTVVKCADISPRQLVALECATKRAMPPRMAMGTKAHPARQQMLALLEDIAAYCFDWRLQYLETNLHALTHRDNDPDGDWNDRKKWRDVLSVGVVVN
jgi:HK97 family phage prohead protease